MEEFINVGKRIPKLDAEEKVTGKAIYIHDLKVPGMLYGKILYSSYPHAKIKSIDISKAEKLSGVKAVLTGYNIPSIKFGVYKDNVPLKANKVCSLRDEIAAVAATDPDIAEEALNLIKVEYEILPAIFDPEEAMKEGAILIHEEHVGGKEKKPTNVLNFPWRLIAGDVEEARKNSAYIAEDRFKVTWVAHCCMGTSGCLALFDLKNNLIMYSITQIPSLAQRDYIDALAAMGLKDKKVRVIKTTIGGGFGSKLDTYAFEYIAILLAHKTRKPVKILFSREEEFFATSPRQPAIINIAQGCTKDGRLTFRDIRMTLDNGAYTSWGATTPSVMMMPIFAIDSQIDILAEMAGIDPLDFRMRNANTPGEVTPQNFKINTCGLRECIDIVAQKLDWRQNRGRRDGRGIGMASMIHVGGGARVYKSDGCGTIIKMDDFGTVNVITGATDMGQGSDTVIAQIAAEELGVRVEDVVVTHTDTDICPWDVGAHASRTTFVAGNSAKGAAKKVKEQLLEVDPEKKSPLGKILRAAHYTAGGSMVMAEYFYDPPNENLDREFKGNLSVTYAYGTHGVEVEVDKETGQVKILKYIAAHDVGRAINPMLLEGQVYGGATMGIGYALTERLILKDGKVMNPNFLDYKMLTAKDVPNIETIVIETNDPFGPFGAKGIGEPGLVPTAPAIANAIYDAVGVRIKDLPITPEKVLAAMKEKVQPK
ncbi:MAG: molybdopterin cofactor-binding domain-containing protein [Thermodesulfobacteriota bacterium]